MYEKGLGGIRSPKQALVWFKRSASQGNIEAMNSIGLMYFTASGVSQDYQKTIEWYTKAANLGNSSAQYNLGVMHLEGQGVSVDSKKAFEWFAKAAELGLAKAQYRVGRIHFMERREPIKAYVWLRLASDQNQQYSMFLPVVSKMLTAEDLRKANEMYDKRKAAIQLEYKATEEF